MHELAITKGIIDIVNSEAEKSGFKNVLEITLRVGEYSGIVPECLREFFPIAAAGSAALDISRRIAEAMERRESAPVEIVCEGPDVQD